MAPQLPPINSPNQTTSRLLNALGGSQALTNQLTAGQIVKAVVGKVQPVTDTQRTVLLEKAAPAPAPAAGKAQATPQSGLQRQFQTLMTQNQLQLAELVVGQSRLSTVTDQPLTRGQNLQIRLNQAGQLVLLPPKTGSAGASSGTNAANAGAPPQPAPTALSGATSASRPPASDLARALQQILPRQGQPDLTARLESLQTALSRLPATPGAEKLGRLLNQLLQQPLDARPTPQAVKTALQNSGTLLENRLAQMLQAQSAGSSTSPAAIVARDAKALALQIASTALSAASGQPARSVLQIPEPLRPLVVSPDSPGAVNLLQQINASPTPPTGEGARTLQTQLLLLVHQLSLVSLAKTRAQQLQPEASRGRAIEGQAPQTPLQFEFPIRHDGGVQPARIRIEEREADEDNARDRTQTRKLWQVQIHLEPPGVGPFYTQLRLLGDRISLTFWSDSPQTLDRAKTLFSDIRPKLEKAGMAVDEVRYRRGEPGTTDNQLRYSLVDIQT